MLIDTARDGRPYFVTTPQGSLQALGTRLQDERTRLSGFEGAVRVHPRDGGPAQVIEAGNCWSTTVAQGTPQPASARCSA